MSKQDKSGKLGRFFDNIFHKKRDDNKRAEKYETNSRANGKYDTVSKADGKRMIDRPFFGSTLNIEKLNGKFANDKGPYRSTDDVRSPADRKYDPIPKKGFINQDKSENNLIDSNTTTNHSPQITSSMNESIFIKI